MKYIASLISGSVRGLQERVASAENFILITIGKIFFSETESSYGKLCCMVRAVLMAVGADRDYTLSKLQDARD